MDIGSYTFEEFRRLAENFHGYAAPGLLIGGYMVEMAKAALPRGTLFEAVVETPKCLPDAVQLLTLCSTGNQRLKIVNTGRYAVSLFDKFTGEGFRVSLDPEKMREWPELYSWFFKQKPKKEQDSPRLESEIREAGQAICRLEAIRIRSRYMGTSHMQGISVCPVCGEAYPADRGVICPGCQGIAPFERREKVETAVPPVSILPLEEAVGKRAAHDMTRIEPGVFKGPEFREGHLIAPGDICRLQKMGRFHVAVANEREAGPESPVHENDAAAAFAKKMAGDGVAYALPPKEGKIDFRAARAGLFRVDGEKLRQFNLVPHVMAASRQDCLLVRKDEKLAGTRAIPLYLDRRDMDLAMSVLTGGPLFQVIPLRKVKAGILVTGTEVFQGLIEDRFIPVISEKVENLGGVVAATAIVPDDREAIAAAASKILEQGIDLLVTTGGLSVDPDDVTRLAMLDLGLSDVVHGMPVLPGAMSLTGKIGNARVLGVPACALYHKTTFLDLILPRLLADQDFTRADAADMASGGYCLGCSQCVWPACPFGK